MKIIFITHPLFLGSQSMPRFANMLYDGMKSRGHDVELLRPASTFSKIPIKKLKKWFGYIDSFIVFSIYLKFRVMNSKIKTLYVLTDHALGPYVPIFAQKSHVIHCHDFLAQRSALDEYPENITSLTGKKYQAFICAGYRMGKNFISVSEKTKTDLSQFLKEPPAISEVVYNGVNSLFYPLEIIPTRLTLGGLFNVNLESGYILHVGGNQWYKNRLGVLHIYEKWRMIQSKILPLIFIGQRPSNELLEYHKSSPFKKDIFFFSDIDDKTVHLAYSGASIFLFPSLAEGFGWPIAEAMASGTLVITTNEAPMTEVAGDSGILINRMPFEENEKSSWASESATILHNALSLLEVERVKKIQAGIVNVSRFDQRESLNCIENIYMKI